MTFKNIRDTRNVVEPFLPIMCRGTGRALRRFDLHWIFPGCQLYFNPMGRVEKSTANAKRPRFRSLLFVKQVCCRGGRDTKEKAHKTNIV